MHHQGSVTASARWWHHLSLVTINDVRLHMEAAAQGLGLATLPPAMRWHMRLLQPPAASSQPEWAHGMFDDALDMQM